jgi:hypothetical protein
MVRLEDVLYDGQAKTGTPDQAGSILIDAIEPFKDALEMLL